MGSFFAKWYKQYNAFWVFCQFAGDEASGQSFVLTKKVYHSFCPAATKGRIYIRLHKLSASLNCIFVQWNLAFAAHMRYTVAERNRTRIFLCLPEMRRVWNETVLFIARQKIRATWKQHICDMQFNAVAVALKSWIAIFFFLVNKKE